MNKRQAERWNARVGAFAAPAASKSSFAPASKGDWAPDLSRIDRNVHDADDEARALRLRAKAINFTCTFLARGLMLLATFAWLIEGLESGAGLDRKRTLAILVQLGDLGRVFNKMMTPGTK